MIQYWAFLNELAQNLEKQYDKSDLQVNWYHQYRSTHLEEQRTELFDGLGNAIGWEFKNTKPYINQISKGCRLCGQGKWSCLFVTGKCNASCFYCPAVQDKDETPQTQKLLFEDPDTYAEYINTFGFKGVSFSGGEPFLVFDRTLEFIKTVRAKCDPGIYIWIYTNGILASDDKFKLLADAGLDEIRFDLGAVNYNPKVLKNASAFIPNVTVEIPAVPEEFDTLVKLIPELCRYGVTNLNLHQLRLTSYNAGNLLKHDYTYLHGEQPVVAESELMALRVIDFVRANELPIGVNYCNFQFKNRFQKAGFRRMMATVLLNEGEEITDNGFIRRIEIIENGMNKTISLDELIAGQPGINQVKISYSGRVLENINENNNTPAYTINGKEFPIVQGLVTNPIIIEGHEITLFLEMIAASGKAIPSHKAIFEAWRHEFIEEGLRDFF